MIILLSPAKTVDFSKPLRVTPAGVIPFAKQSMGLNSLLRGFTVDGLMALMGISRDLADLNFERNHLWHFPFKASQTQNAIYAFRGETYHGFEADTLSEQELALAQKRVVILSGLYGILRPLDAILPYRLEMGIRLANPQGDNLYLFWRDTIAQHLNLLLSDSQESVVVNLASEEYFKSVNLKALKGRVITPRFLDLTNSGQYKVVSVYAKKARGAMARFLCTPEIDSYRDLLAFQSLGYHYDAAQSTADNPVFVR